MLLLATTAGGSPGDTPQIEFTVLGPPETVFSWTDDRCADWDVPDAPLRAFRRATGEIVAFASHYIWLPLTGPDLRNLERKCDPAFISPELADPSRFSDRAWLTSSWTEDGQAVAVLAHTEYQAERHPKRCRGTSPSTCRYNAVTLYESGDGGRSFSRASAVPIVAPAVRQATRQETSIGFQLPSNMVEVGQWKYVTVRSMGSGRQPAGTCLMRARDPLSASSWEVLREGRFVPAAYTPYAPGEGNETLCSPIEALNGIVWSLLRHEPTGLFIALFTTFRPGSRVIVAALATSPDLLHWSDSRVIDDLVFQWNSTGCPTTPYWHYPSLLDPGSERRNFDTVDGSAVLFLTRMRVDDCVGTMERDLVVLPVRIDVSAGR